MSLNHSSVNRLSFCSVSPCCSIWCTYIQISASTLGVIFKNLFIYLFNPCLLNNLIQPSYKTLAVTGIVLLSNFVSSKFRFPVMFKILWKCLDFLTQTLS